MQPVLNSIQTVRHLNAHALSHFRNLYLLNFSCLTHTPEVCMNPTMWLVWAFPRNRILTPTAIQNGKCVVKNTQKVRTQWSSYFLTVIIFAMSISFNVSPCL